MQNCCKVSIYCHGIQQKTEFRNCILSFNYLFSFSKWIFQFWYNHLSLHCVSALHKTAKQQYYFGEEKTQTIYKNSISDLQKNARKHTKREKTKYFHIETEFAVRASLQTFLKCCSDSIEDEKRICKQNLQFYFIFFTFSVHSYGYASASSVFIRLCYTASTFNAR